MDDLVESRMRFKVENFLVKNCPKKIDQLLIVSNPSHDMHLPICLLCSKWHMLVTSCMCACSFPLDYLWLAGDFSGEGKDSVLKMMKKVTSCLHCPLLWFLSWTLSQKPSEVFKPLIQLISHVQTQQKKIREFSKRKRERRTEKISDSEK